MKNTGITTVSPHIVKFVITGLAAVLATLQYNLFKSGSKKQLAGIKEQKKKLLEVTNNKYSEETAKLAAQKKLEEKINDELAKFNNEKTKLLVPMLNRHQAELRDLEMKYTSAKLQVEESYKAELQLAKIGKEKELAQLKVTHAKALDLEKVKLENEQKKSGKTLGKQKEKEKEKEKEQEAFPQKKSIADSVKELQETQQQAFKTKTQELDKRIEALTKTRDERIQKIEAALKNTTANLKEQHKFEEGHLDTVVKIKGRYMDAEHEVQRAELKKAGNIKEARQQLTANYTAELGTAKAKYDEALAQFKLKGAAVAETKLLDEIAKGAPEGGAPGGFSALAALLSAITFGGATYYGLTHEAEVTKKLNDLLGDYQEQTTPKQEA